MLVTRAVLLEEQQNERYEYLREYRVLLRYVILRPDGDSGGDGIRAGGDRLVRGRTLDNFD